MLEQEGQVVLGQMLSGQLCFFFFFGVFNEINIKM